MELIKLTDIDGYTRRGCEGETKWSPGFKLTLPGGQEKPQLCTPDVIHAYRSAPLALMLNPSHANLDPFLVWIAEGDICVEDWGKCGCFSLTTCETLEMPEWFTDTTIRKRVTVRFACLCARAVLLLFEKRFPTDDRPRKAIEVAEKYLKRPDAAYADAAARAAAAAADAAYAYAADAAYADAADAAARAAAHAADAAYADAAHAAARAARAAHAAARAAHAAAHAAHAARAAHAYDVNFVDLANQAVEIEVRHG